MSRYHRAESRITIVTPVTPRSGMREKSANYNIRTGMNITGMLWRSPAGVSQPCKLQTRDLEDLPTEGFQLTVPGLWVFASAHRLGSALTVTRGESAHP